MIEASHAVILHDRESAQSCSAAMLLDSFSPTVIGMIRAGTSLGCGSRMTRAARRARRSGFPRGSRIYFPKAR